MKKPLKTAILITLTGILTCGSLFAQPTNHKNRNFPGKKFQNKNFPDNGFPGMDFRNGKNGKPGKDGKTRKTGKKGFNFRETDENRIIGKIKSVDENKSLITVSDPDGKETTIAVTSFTSITNMARDEVAFADITKDTEVMIRVYKTESKTPVAALILLSK